MSNNNAKTTGYDPRYHDRQFVSPYQSTVSFCDWLVGLDALGSGHSTSICDLGCGKGASLYYMAKRFPESKFTGLDIDEQLIRDGCDYFSKMSVPNCRLSVCDLHSVDTCVSKGEFDGVISLQTLSWLPGYEKALDAIISLSPEWIALTSLFYEGPVEAKTVITQFEPDAEDEVILYYNTYSLPRVKQYLHDRGFAKFKHKRFDISIDLPKNTDGRMQTYTEKTDEGRRLQISGPLLMNWYFIYASLG